MEIKVYVTFSVPDTYGYNECENYIYEKLREAAEGLEGDVEDAEFK